MRIIVFIAVICVFLGSGAIARTDLPLPRFVTVKASEANIRTGPGLRYQIKWVMVRNQMPVEVIAEFEQWRKIRDIDGDEGWVHRAMLSNNRTIMVTGSDIQTMLRYSAIDSSPVARIEPGVNARLNTCKKHVCHIEVAGHEGWLPRTNIWGIYPTEMVE